MVQTSHRDPEDLVNIARPVVPPGCSSSHSKQKRCKWKLRLTLSKVTLKSDHRRIAEKRNDAVCCTA
jgi:hypothetical protein